MKNTSKIAVIGGTGKSGKYLVQQLLKGGYNLRLLVRNPEKSSSKNIQIEIVQGDVSNYTTVLNLIKGCNAIISTLGIGIPQSPPTIFSTATKNIIRAMNELGVKRYIVITGLHVDTPADTKSAKVKFGTDWMYQNYPKSTADRQREFDILSKSKVEWTLVRLPMINLTPEQKRVMVSLKDCLGENISATDLADFLIGQLNDNTFLRKAPFIANV